MRKGKWRFGVRDDLAVVRETVRLRIESAGERRKVAVFATRRLLIVWERPVITGANLKSHDQER